MKVARTRAGVDAALGGLPHPGSTVALVPTMGALHAGHDALFDVATSAADNVVVSIFVNPLQFAPGEDLATYPRTFDDDLAHCASHGIDVVFAPTVETVYSQGEPQVTVDPGPLALDLEGGSRPTHFRGVLTVVTKLFGLIRPDVAVFGTKDYQQLALIRRCVTDLSLPVEIVGVETVRADDGLALSSRNRYLTPGQRETALALNRALTRGRLAGPGGVDDVVNATWAQLVVTPELVVDYLALRGTDLGPAPAKGDARLMVAAWVGSTRLIDNTAVLLGQDGAG